MTDRDPPGVLVVDDQPDVRALLQTILQHHGFTVWLAPAGLARSNCIDSKRTASI